MRQTAELRVEQLPNGRYYVVVPPENDGRLVVYARVSADQKEDLDRQVGRAVEWATQQGYRPDEVVKEIGSGLNGNRRRLRRLVADPTRMIVVEHRERLCRFGFEYVEAALAGRGARILVGDGRCELEDDPGRDRGDDVACVLGSTGGVRPGGARSERWQQQEKRNESHLPDTHLADYAGVNRSDGDAACRYTPSCTDR